MPPTNSLSVLFDVFVTAQRVRRLLDFAMTSSPLRPDEYAIYSAIDQLGPLSATELSRSLGMPLTTMSDYIRTLLDRGHVTRRRNPRDRRAWLLSLTAGGQRAYTAAGDLFEDAISLVVPALSVSEEEASRTLAAVGQACESALDTLELQRLAAAG